MENQTTENYTVWKEPTGALTLVQHFDDGDGVARVLIPAEKRDEVIQKLQNPTPRQ